MYRFITHISAATSGLVGSSITAALRPASAFGLVDQVRWASKKAGGSTKNGRDSHSKRLGLKKWGGMTVRKGNILIRQRGTMYHPKDGVGMGRDHTLYALKDGYLYFKYNKWLKRQMVYVLDENRHQLEGKNGAGAAEAKETSDPVSSVLDPSTKATPVQTGGLDVPREDLSHLPKAPGGGLNRKSTAAEVSAFSEHRIKERKLRRKWKQLLKQGRSLSKMQPIAQNNINMVRSAPNVTLSSEIAVPQQLNAVSQME